MSGRRWCFIVARPFLPAGNDPDAAGLGGTEQAVISLTAALAALGEAVTVAGGSATPRVRDGVVWQSAPPTETDIAVAVNDARLLPRDARTRAVWFHNEVELGKEVRRGRLAAILRARPVAVFVGAEQARCAARLLPFRRRVVIPLGLPDALFSIEAAGSPPPPVALFTSQAYRGLRQVLALWQGSIAPAVPGAVLRAYIAAGDVPAYRKMAPWSGVDILPRIGHGAALRELSRARVLMAPGHVSETFCLAAAEAVALGVPVVTRGIGALEERVRNGVDGFVCANDAEMAARTRALLTDDALWSDMHARGFAARDGREWRSVATQWLAELTIENHNY